MTAIRVRTSTALVAILAGVVVALAVTPAGARADVSVTCNQGPCNNGWYNTDVTVDWTVDHMIASGCVDQTLTTDSATAAGTELSCAEQGGGEPVTILVKIDKTPPVATGAAAGRPADRGIWFNHPVTYTFSGDDALSGIDSCTRITYSGPDTASATVNGTCKDKAGNESLPVGAAVHYDATPPAVGGVAIRPPDFNGWYNHPVSFTFFGADATSGLAGCSNPTYAGPTDSTAVVEGTCSDRAGNRAASSASLRYDSTPPAPVNLTIKPRNGALLLTWASAADVNSVVITRSQQGSSAGAATVYSGSGRSVLDKGLVNGTKYRYTITGTDQAGNSSSQTIPAVPTGSTLLPAVGARVTSAPLLTWKKVKRARYYNVQLFRGGHKILSEWPGTNSFQVRATWRFRGKRYSLTPGHYRWYVWPGLGKRSQHRYGHILGRSSFRLVAP